jgi:predicted nucleic acid-binding protein
VNSLVVDASAALTLVLGGPGRERVRAELRDRILAGDRILVPPVFWLEIIETLAERHRQRPSDIVEAVYELEQLGLETADVGRPGILATVDAVGRGLRASDAAYLVLAEAADAALVTANPTLGAVAGARATLVGDAGRGRAPRPDRSWLHWKGAAAYLRELRRSL